ncbi:MAG: YIP1 family protein [Deltaproteobacteria bacterium]|nr:YIP1 family protein [Deltaproteobacteria bacterium]
MRCPKCALVFDALPGQMSCPSCGAPIELNAAHANAAHAEPSGPSPWEAPASVSSDDDFSSGADGIPWEVRPSASSLLETVREVLLRPAALFERAEPDRSMGLALVFGLLLGVTGGVLGLVMQRALASQMLRFLERIAPDLEPLLAPFANAQGSTDQLVSLIVIPFAVGISLFISAGATHLALIMQGGQRGSFETTFRAMAYAYAPSPLQVVPLFGSIGVTVWSVFIAVTAIRSLHRVSTGKAVIAVLAPLFLATFCCCCFAILGVIFAGSVGSLLHTGSGH